ncbi:MAG: hypothetical protein AAF226_00340 [Verrucomicrobiota bacterium]
MNYICPSCGAEVKVGSKGCPKCNNLDPWEIEGNDAYDGLDLPDDDFDYDEFIEREFGTGGIGKKGQRWNGLHPFWWITALVTLIIFVLYFVL